MTTRAFAAAASLLALATPLAAQQAPIIQPGAPGSENRTLRAEDATKLAATTFTPQDARFMQMMIPHHAQAVDMVALVEERTSNPDILAIAGRISAGQDDEIAFMRDWPDAHASRWGGEGSRCCDDGERTRFNVVASLGPIELALIENVTKRC